MEQSLTIGKLSEALSKVQAVLEGAKLDSTNPFFKSKYSDLTSVWAACRKPLADNGLSVIQTCQSETADMVIVETMLCHISGEWVRGKLAMRPVKSDPQGVGSCITYARRYSLAAIVGVAPEDDDGNIASGKSDKPETRHTTSSKTETKASEKHPQETSPPQAGKDTGTTTEETDKKKVIASLVSELTKYCMAEGKEPEDVLKGLTLFKGDKNKDVWMHYDKLSTYKESWLGAALGKLRKLQPKEDIIDVNADMQMSEEDVQILCPVMKHHVGLGACTSCKDKLKCQPYQEFEHSMGVN